MEKTTADALFASAAGVLSTLVDRTVTAGPCATAEHDASIRVEPATVATLTKIPAAGLSFVTEYNRADLVRVVELMLGSPAGGGEMDAMQLSIVSETVAQISSAMAERLTQHLKVASEDIHSEIPADAAGFPAPPFHAFVATLEVGSDFRTSLTIAFDGVAHAKLASLSAAPAAPSELPKVFATQQAQPVSYSSMAPTPIRAAAAGQANLELVHDIPLEISAVLGQTRLSLRDVVALQSGSVFELDKQSADPVDLYVNNILIARGEVVVVDDRFAVKISELNPVVDRL